MNIKVEERMMRMGIEYRFINRPHFLGDVLHELRMLAIKQLHDEDKQMKINSKYDSLIEWFKCKTELKFAMSYHNNILQVIRVLDISNMRLIEWRNNGMPLVECLI